MDLTKEQAIKSWTEYQRLISVGAFTERSAEHYETDTWPEDGVEESVHNLEIWAYRQGLEFCWIPGSQSWSLEPISPEEEQSTVFNVYEAGFGREQPG